MDVVVQLQKLAKLKAAGALTDAEFDTAKQLIPGAGVRSASEAPVGSNTAPPPTSSQTPKQADGDAAAEQRAYEQDLAAFGEIPLAVLEAREPTAITLEGDKIYAMLHGNNPKVPMSLGPSLHDPTVNYTVIARPLRASGAGGWGEIISFYLDRALGFYKIPNT